MWARWSASLLLASILASVGCAGCIDREHFFGDYHGTVVDAETGEPIEGAVVVVYWEKCFVYEMNGCGTPHSVRETVTGPSGEFSIPARRDLDWNPLSYVARRSARITVYAVDHLPLSSARATVAGLEGDLDTEMMRGRAIPLRRLDDPRDLSKYRSASGLLRRDEKRLAPHLTRAFERQEEKWKLNRIREHQKQSREQ